MNAPTANPFGGMFSASPDNERREAFLAFVEKALERDVKEGEINPRVNAG